MGVREKCFSTVCLYLGNTEQGRVTLVWKGKAWSWRHGESQRTALWLCSSLSPTKLPGIESIIHLGWMCWAFEGKIWSGGKHGLRMSNWSIKHLCGAGGDKALWDGLWLSGFGPSSANYEGRGEPEVWAPFSQLVEHMSHPNKDQLYYLCWGIAQEKAEGSFLEPSTLNRACSCARHGPAHLIPAWTPWFLHEYHMQLFLGCISPSTGHLLYILSYFCCSSISESHLYVAFTGEKLRRVYASSNMVCIIDNEWGQWPHKHPYAGSFSLSHWDCWLVVLNVVLTDQHTRKKKLKSRAAASARRQQEPVPAKAPPRRQGRLTDTRGYTGWKTQTNLLTKLKMALLKTVWVTVKSHSSLGFWDSWNFLN